MIVGVAVLGIELLTTDKDFLFLLVLMSLISLVIKGRKYIKWVLLHSLDFPIILIIPIRSNRLSMVKNLD